MPRLENSTRGFYGASVALKLTNCHTNKKVETRTPNCIYLE